ncbi:hypothetical protein Sango_0014300 [Sesamum angolense]|uniref:Uncharacterized protein n=1 Tax=Sesamum angolense TaxID=2727404 RepID=A0AAE2C547_9LAMI|nr:hypothetical protein Sango_0014300 [Sesamum angolense]
MIVNVVSFKLKSTAKDSAAPKNNAPNEKLQRKLTLKEMQEKQYPFLDSNVPEIFDDLVHANSFKFPEMKLSEEAGQIDNPKYYKPSRSWTINTRLLCVQGQGYAIGSLSASRNGTLRKVLGDSKPFSKAEAHFADAKYYIEDATKGKEISPSEQPKSHGFVPSIQKEGVHEALVIDVKGFKPKASKLLIKDKYNPKEKLNLGKLHFEATHKKPHGLNATQVMLKEKGHEVQDSRVGLGFTPPKPVRITIKKVSCNYTAEEFSSTEDDKSE